MVQWQGTCLESSSEKPGCDSALECLPGRSEPLGSNPHTREQGRSWVLGFHLSPTRPMTDQDEIHSDDKGSAGTPGGLKKQLKAMEDKGRRTGK